MQLSQRKIRASIRRMDWTPTR